MWKKVIEFLAFPSIGEFIKSQGFGLLVLSCVLAWFVSENSRFVNRMEVENEKLRAEVRDCYAEIMAVQSENQRQIINLLQNMRK